MASMRGDVKGVRRLLSLGLVDVNCIKGAALSETTWNSFGATPLHWAAQYGHRDIVKLLMDNGAKPDKKDILGRTPLQRTAEKGHTDLVKLLVDRGADPNGVLNYAVQSGSACQVKLLIDHGADPHKAEILFIDLVKTLFDGGADPDATS